LADTSPHDVDKQLGDGNALLCELQIFILYP
jgi:hypothetical protein